MYIYIYPYIIHPIPLAPWPSPEVRTLSPASSSSSSRPGTSSKDFKALHWKGAGWGCPKRRRWPFHRLDNAMAHYGLGIHWLSVGRLVSPLLSKWNECAIFVWLKLIYIYILCWTRILPGIHNKVNAWLRFGRCNSHVAGPSEREGPCKPPGRTH